MKTLLAALLLTAGTVVASPAGRCPDPAVVDVRATKIKSSPTASRYQFVVEVSNIGSQDFTAGPGSTVSLQFSAGTKNRRTMATQPLPDLKVGEVTTLTFEADVDKNGRLPDWESMSFPAEICGVIVVKPERSVKECDVTNNRL